MPSNALCLTHPLAVGRALKGQNSLEPQGKPNIQSIYFRLAISLQPSQIRIHPFYKEGPLLSPRKEALLVHSRYALPLAFSHKGKK